LICPGQQETDDAQDRDCALTKITLVHPSCWARIGARVGTMAAATKPQAFIQLPTPEVWERPMSVAIVQASVWANPAPPSAMLSRPR
jgi:hypothetical protein